MYCRLPSIWQEGEEEGRREETRENSWFNQKCHFSFRLIVDPLVETVEMSSIEVLVGEEERLEIEEEKREKEKTEAEGDEKEEESGKVEIWNVTRIVREFTFQEKKVDSDESGSGTRVSPKLFHIGSRGWNSG